MAGTIVTDRIESDASYASRINVASEIQFSNTITGNVNIDSGLLFVDAVNNRVGIGVNNPESSLDVRGTTSILRMQSTTGTNSVYQRLTNDGGQLYLGIDNSAGNDLVTGSSAYAGVLVAPGTTRSLHLGTNGTARLSIDASGRVTMPSQPALFAQPDVNGGFATGTSSTATIYGWNTSGGVRYNRGFTIGAGTASLNRVANAASTGRITVPSSGIYALYFDMRNESQATSGSSIPYGADSNGGQAGVYVNSTQVIRRHINSWSNFPYNHCIIHAMLNLNANDYIEVGAWWNGSTTGSNLNGYNDTVNWLYLVKIA